MTFVFKPGPPKPAVKQTVAGLKRAINENNTITGAKDVGDGVTKVFMSGPENYYIRSTYTLDVYLRSKGIDV